MMAGLLRLDAYAYDQLRSCLLCRHVVLPTDIAKLLPKNRLLSEVQTPVAVYRLVIGQLSALCALCC
jgi:hypothetical protein